MRSLANLGLAVQQNLEGTTGDRTSPFTRMGNTLRETGAVYTRWHESTSKVFEPLPPLPNRPLTPVEQIQRATVVIRRVQAVMGAVMGLYGMAQDMMNVGFANLTAPLAAIFPSLPAARLTSLYIGTPHAHSHPPSLIPPAPPIPLPSMGPVLLGTCVRVLINNLPAARCGDIGLAITCGGLTPFFQIATGSSNVFIGGTRSARMGDICRACVPGESRSIDASRAMAAIGKAAALMSSGLAAMGMISGLAGVVADAAEAAVEDDAAMAAAKTLAAQMGAAQLAADAAAMVATQTMGKDPGIPPSTGAIVIGSFNVLVGGFPMVNIPNPIDVLLKRLARYKFKSKQGELGEPAGQAPRHASQ